MNTNAETVRTGGYSSQKEGTAYRQVWKKTKRDWQLYALLALPLAFFLLFKYGPVYGITAAFKDYNLFKGIAGSEWIGLDTFRRIFADREFYNALRNTLLLNGLDLLFSFPAPILLAVMLHELTSSRIRKISQTILYLPHFISWVIIGGIVYQVFATHSGIVNLLLGRLGISAIPFLSDSAYWLATYLATGMWQSAGWGTIIYLAAIAGINKELYEAAKMDGAGRLALIRHITLPGLQATMITLLILNLGQMVQIGFERPYIIGNVMVKDVAEVLSTFTYTRGLQSGQFSFATGVGLFQGLVGLIFILGANTLSKRWTGKGIL
ncbi:ABC transporter permease subunit [Paenibacillus peoriae]|uniref:ABC transporter permease n=1 Tax=Paenibacillus peoriae TaxID=59893 RepID=UPI00026C5A45|nr:ABC transporter permease subunit [Paenibacillus peoriae]MEC0181226.1 ABC transporter permease subunit [Paenibacillus peoriae]